jgi:hypothetical protein
MIVNDACTINVLTIIIDDIAYPHSLSKRHHKVTLQFGASLTYDTSSVNYNRNMFIIQAAGLQQFILNLVKRIKPVQIFHHMQNILFCVLRRKHFV